MPWLKAFFGAVFTTGCGLVTRRWQVFLWAVLAGLLWLTPPALSAPHTTDGIAQTLVDAAPPSVDTAPPNRSVLGAEDVSSEKVSQFVNAYIQVLELVEQREGELQGAETEVESARVQHEIERAAFVAIADAGLTWQEYLQLLGLANSDPDFGERVATQLLEEID